MEDRLPAVRANALKALALDPPAKPAPVTLIKAGLKDPDPTVRREAAEATRILGPKEAIKILRSAAKDSDWLTRATAARLFGQRGNPDLIPDLFKMLQDADSYVRRFARRSLLELAEKAKAEDYLPSLKSKDRTTQIVAALALVRLNDGRGAEVLLAEIANPLGIERGECVKAISKLVDPRVVPALRAATGDKDPEVRVVSLIALGLLKDKDSAPLFKKISADPASPKEVKLAAAKALDLLTKPADQP
jgi:HEAT repeat protein